MEHLQEDIRETLEKILNENTQDVRFDVSLFHDNIDATFQRYEDDPDSYDIEKVKVIPTMIEEIIADYDDLEDITIAEADMNLSFLVPTMQANVSNVMIQENTSSMLKAIEEMRRKYRYQALPLGVEGYQLLKYGDITLKPKPGLEEIEHFSIEITVTHDKDEEIVVSENEQFKIYKEDGKLVVFIDGVGTDYEYTLNQPVFIDVITQNGVTLVVIDGEEEELDRINPDNEFVLKPFEGLYHFVGINAEYQEGEKGYDQLLIEQFDPIKDDSSEQEYEIEIDEDKYGANLVGTEGLLTITFSSPYPITQQFAYGNAGLEFQIFQASYILNYSEGVFLGSQYRYFLDDVQIYPTSRKHDYQIELASAQMVKKSTMKSLGTGNIVTNEFTLPYKNEPKTKEIYEHVLSVKDLSEYDKNTKTNKKWKLTIRHPHFKQTYDVVINEYGASPNYNAPTSFSFSLVPIEDIPEK